MSHAAKTQDIRLRARDKAFFSGAGRLESLAEASRLLRQPTAQLIVIGGPEGIGKTTMLQELRREFFAASTVISVQGHFGTLEKMLTAFAEQLEMNLSSTEQPDTDVAGQIARRLNEIGREKPVLVLIDDAHALPLAVIRTLAVLFHERLDNVRMALFVDSEAVMVVADYLRRQAFSSINIRRISRSETKAYLAHRYAATPKVSFTEQELEQIHSAGDGVPARINVQAEYCLKQRAAQTAHARRTLQSASAVPVPPRAVAPFGLAAAACLMLAVTAVTIGTTVKQATEHAVPAGIVAHNENTELLEEPINDAKDGYDVELPEEFVEFSHQLSEDELDLLQTSPDQYVVQYRAGDSESDMQAFVAEYDELGVKMYRSLVDGEPWYKAVSTGFANPEIANSMIKFLPSELRAEKPWVRSVASVQEEILLMGEAQLTTGTQPHHEGLAMERWLAQL